MRLPRDISASELIKILAKYDYVPTRQSGSHIRLTTKKIKEHHITIPNHNPIKIGTLNSILADIANHSGLSKSELMEELFK